MNKLNIDKQASIISALVEGNSIRSTERMTGVHRDTIMRLLVKIGAGCEVIMDHTMRHLPCKNIQVDEIWSFIGKKQRNLKKEDNRLITGDMWTYVALDSDSKLIPAYRISKRNAKNTRAFMIDLSSRLENRVQLSSDSLHDYIEAVELGFGASVDYAQVVKAYEAVPTSPGRYSPPKIVSAKPKLITGAPDFDLISTSHVERQNLTMRMSMRRFTRLTNAFSKKLENMKAAVALHFVHYNFVRIHSALKVTPAMEAGIVSGPWGIDDLLKYADK